MLLKLVKWLLALVVIAVVALAGWLTVAPPALIRVASAYSAKIVCSNVFIAGRDPAEVLRDDVQAPGHWLLKYIKIDVNQQESTARAGLFGLFGKGVAVMRDARRHRLRQRAGWRHRQGIESRTAAI